MLETTRLKKNKPDVTVAKGRCRNPFEPGVQGSERASSAFATENAEVRGEEATTRWLSTKNN
jgi:hypothetical protein